jgi:hypothetical protein
MPRTDAPDVRSLATRPPASDGERSVERYSRRSYPHETVPDPEPVVVRAEVEGAVPSETKTSHHGLGTQVVGCGVRQDFSEAHTDEYVVKRRSCRFRRKAVSPRMAAQSPTDVIMFSERMIAPIRHHSCVAQEAGVSSIDGSLDDPASVAVVVERLCESVELAVACVSIEGASEIVHHFRVGVHSCERNSIFVVPTPKNQAIGHQRTRSRSHVGNVTLPGSLSAPN